jgi:methylenetetrahydrofolate reductase (NADPH)
MIKPHRTQEISGEPGDAIRSGAPDIRHDETGAAVEALVRSAKIEFIPMRGAEEKVAAVPAGTPLAVTCSSKFGLDRTLEYSALAAKAGHRVIPHLAARQVIDEADLRDFISRLKDLGVSDLYVIGGDAPEPAGAFSSAAELLASLAKIDHHLQTIGVACYPEGHPAIPDADLLEALRLKQPQADYMVSQLCFDPDALIGWLGRMRSEGIELPLHVGLAAPMELHKLAQLSLRIGVGSSIRYLTKQRGLVGNLLRGRAYRPETLLYALDEALTSAELGIEQLHLFSFNQIDVTLEWQRQVARISRVAEEKSHAQ